MRQNGNLEAAGNIVKYIPDHGKLEAKYLSVSKGGFVCLKIE